MKNTQRFLISLFRLVACSAFLVLGRSALAAEEPAHTEKAAVHAEAPAHAEGAAGAGEHAETVEEFSSMIPTLKQLSFSYLTVYMFCLSLTMGSLFLVIVHHLFDAGWSVPIRRVTEQLSSVMFPWMLILVLPIVAAAWLGDLHPWFKIDPANDHALDVKKALFNPIAFTVFVPALVASWGAIARTFRSYSLAQDKDGAAIWTTKSRKLAAWGIYYFAFTLTLGCFYLMKSLQYQFFSTMYGVYYFAGSVWTTFATVYVIINVLSRPGMPLQRVILKKQIQDVGVLFFAFTVFYAYIHFSQYFLIWNAAMPEETFWYVKREAGTWKWVGFTILFGHFFVPFLCLLNQDIKRNLTVMFPMALWAWLMHYTDMTFNVMPVLYPNGLHLAWWDLVIFVAMPLFLGMKFWKAFMSSPAYPLRDPRFKESVTEHIVPGPGEVAAH